MYHVAHGQPNGPEHYLQSQKPACPRQTMPRATLATITEPLLQAATGNGPRRGRGGSQVWERGPAAGVSESLPEAEGDSAAGRLAAAAPPTLGSPPVDPGSVSEEPRYVWMPRNATLCRVITVARATVFPPLPCQVSRQRSTPAVASDCGR